MGMIYLFITVIVKIQKEQCTRVLFIIRNTIVQIVLIKKNIECKVSQIEQKCCLSQEIQKVLSITEKRTIYC